MTLRKDCKCACHATPNAVVHAHPCCGPGSEGWLLEAVSPSENDKMYFRRKKVIARNLLVGAGALYLSEWLPLAIPLQLGFYNLTAGLIYRGQFNGAVVMPLVEHFPVALLAAAVGAAVICLVESE